MVKNWSEKSADKIVNNVLESIDDDFGGSGFDATEFFKFDERLSRAYQNKDHDEVKIVCEAYRETVQERISNGKISTGRDSQRTHPKDTRIGTMEKTSGKQKQAQNPMATCFPVCAPDSRGDR